MRIPRRTVSVAALSLALAAAGCKATSPAKSVTSLAPTTVTTPATTPPATTPSTGGPQAGPVPAATIGDLCDAISIADVERITGMQVRIDTPGTATYCNWWQGRSGLANGGITFTIKTTSAVDALITRAIATGTYQAVSGLGVKAAGATHVMAAGPPANVIVYADMGPYGLSLSITYTQATVPEAVAFINAAVPHI